MKVKKLIAITFGAILLNGCANLNDGINNSLKNINSTVSNTIPKLTAQRTNQNTAQICAEAKNNNQRAEELFTGKIGTFEGKVSLNKGLSFTDDIYLYSGKNQIAVEGYPNTRDLNNGQNLKLDGIITSITTQFNCSIRIKYSK